MVAGLTVDPVGIDGVLESRPTGRLEPLLNSMLPSDASFTANSDERWLQPAVRSSRAAPSLNSMLPSAAGFSARSAERWLQPAARSSRAEPSRYVAPLAAVLIYALMALLVAFEDRFEPAAPPAPEEIPIEIVAEPPPPPPPAPPAPTPAPPQADQPLDEKPAFDAPRPANDEKTDREAPDTASKAPAAPPTDKPPGQDAGTGKATGTEAEAETPAKENPADPAKDKTVPAPAPNGDVKLEAPEPPPTPAETVVPPQNPAAAAGARIPTFASVPDVQFSGAAKAAPVAGGNAKATYLTIVYGMIIPRVHKPTGAHPKWARSEGVVSFAIDGRGYLTQRWTTQPSGSPELDAAIFEAIGQASPFPPPPRGRPIYLHISYRPD
jgi:protein TonB